MLLQLGISPRTASGKHPQVCNILNIEVAPGNYSENLERSGMHKCRVWEYGNLTNVGTEDIRTGGRRIKENHSGSTDQKVPDSRYLNPSCPVLD